MSDNRTRSASRSRSDLLAYLRQLKNDRGAMADLRCALNPASAPAPGRCWPRGRHRQSAHRSRCRPVRLPSRRNAGAATWARPAAGSQRQNNSFEARFRRLLACDRDEICDRLRPVILAAKAKGHTRELRAACSRIFATGVTTCKARWAREYWGAPGTRRTGSACSIGGQRHDLPHASHPRFRHRRQAAAARQLRLASGSVESFSRPRRPAARFPDAPRLSAGRVFGCSSCHPRSPCGPIGALPTQKAGRRSRSRKHISRAARYAFQLCANPTKKVTK